jgi:hypothetical protein
MSERAAVAPEQALLNSARFTAAPRAVVVSSVDSADGDSCPWPRHADLGVPSDFGPSASPPAPKSSWRPQDIVDEWGVGSFPASDPPANW